MSLFWALFLFCVTFAPVEARAPWVQLEAQPERMVPWEPVRRADPSALLTVYVAVHVPKSAWMQLEEVALAVSDPSNPMYGQHLSKAEVDEMAQPTQESIYTVRRWLEDAKMRYAATSLADYFIVRGSVAELEALLHTQFHLYHHSRDGALPPRIFAPHYSVPKSVAPHVDFIGGVVRAFTPQQQLNPTRRQFGPTVDPSDLRSRYKVGDASANASVTQSIASFLQQYVSTSDLSSFLNQYCENKKIWHQRNVSVFVGPNDESNPGIEASLDLQYIMGMGSGVETWVWSTGGLSPYKQEPFLEWLIAVNNASTIPHLFSISYTDDEKSLGQKYTARVSNDLSKLAARGVTVLAAAGDYGVQGATQEDCPGGIFIPCFPASSPWVTSVGGTNTEMFENTEIAWSDGGGGFSNFFPRPAWQRAAVDAYLKKGPAPGNNFPATSHFNQSARGYPDVSAFAVGFEEVVGGYTQPVSGTSAATPTFAGIVSLLNSIRLAQGKSTLGFVNPLLYQNPSALLDITAGSNPGCGTDGFPAIEGWDAVTGLGTPLYNKLKDIV